MHQELKSRVCAIQILTSRLMQAGNCRRQKKEEEAKTKETEGTKQVAEAEAARPRPSTLEQDVAMATSACGGSEKSGANIVIPEFAPGLQVKNLPLPTQRPQTPLSAHGASSARCASEAVSRCSSVPTSWKRGPSAAAEGGASLFLSDQSRGAFFGTTARGIEILPDTLGPGPACYNANVAASKIFLRANMGSMRFSAEPRKTMECMYVRGASGPGSGKYHPPPRSTSRGGSFPRAARWNSRPGVRGLPGTPPALAGPGPTSYKPNHSSLSTLR
mmetsp:Transcript_53177/g.65190  ORF Transcript_53177/g.65190 Transcript_53177/m.65190 type:complete len:274 (+) Transcript_53177:48-869(+)